MKTVTSQPEDTVAMHFMKIEQQIVVADVSEKTSQAVRQTGEGLREKSMNALSMKRTVRLAARLAAFSTAVLGLMFAGMDATAQGVPAYVVTSHASLIPPPIQGPAYNMAVNSRGDLFVNTGENKTGAIDLGNITFEYPADGSTPIAVFTVAPGFSYGPSGVAVDSMDNVYVTTFYGPQGSNGVDSQIYELPYTSGSYPGPYVYNHAAPPGSCLPAAVAVGLTPARGPNTGVCAVGQYTGAAYYYWQPVGFAVDGQGNSYMFSNYDNTYGSGEKGIFFCNILCNEQQVGAGAAALVTVPNGIKSIAADSGDDVFWTDGTTVSYFAKSAEQLSNGTSNVTILDSSYNNPTGINFDKAGNLYVQDNTGIYETPLINGTLTVGSKFLILPIVAGAAASPAVDSLGNLYYAPYAGGNNPGDIEKVQIFSGTFPAAPVGTASATKMFTIAFNSSVTLGAITALQAGVPATEFTVAPGTCTSGSSFATGSTCSFTATFTPNAVGRRKGAVSIASSTGTTTTTFLTGTGTGNAVTVDPGTPTLVGSGLQTPNGIALDAVGDVFVADSTANAVYEYPAGGGAAVSIGSGLNVPTGVAVDPVGNVFIVNQGPAQSAPSSPVQSGSVVEVPNIGGALTTSAQSTVFSSGLFSPTDIVIDGEGNFFITNTAANQVIQFPSISRYATATSAISRGQQLVDPTGIALDSSGNVYVASTGTNQVIKIGEQNQTIIGAGLSSPTGVTVDPSGSVLIADQGTGRLLRVPNEQTVKTTTTGTGSTATTVTTVAYNLNADDQVLMDSPLLYPFSMRLDATGNLYVSDSVEADVYQLARTSGVINFGNYNLNTSSGPETIVLSSAGTNAATQNTDSITLGSPLYPAVPAASGFTVSAGTAVTACKGTTLTPGSNCTISAIYSPTVLGAVDYPLNFATSGTNTGSPTVELIGTGVDLDSATATIAVIDPPPPAPLTYGSTFTIALTITPTGNTPTPTGLVVFAFDGQNQRPIALDSTGAAKITLSSQAGQHTVQAHYEGDVNYASVETALLPLTINQATVLNVLTITGDSDNPLSSAPTDAINMTATLTPSVAGLFGGTVSFMAGSTVLGVVGVSGPDKMTHLYSAGLSLATLPLGFYTITAVYSGNTNYAGITSNAVGVTVSNPTFTVTPSAYAVTSTANDPGVINLNVESYSGFLGGVDFQCAGLPANAYCVFRPALASLLQSANPLVTDIPPVPVVLQFKTNQNPAQIQGSQLSSMGWLGAVFAGALLLYARRKRSIRQLIGTSLLVLLSFGGIAALNGCGSSSSSNYVTPPGNYLVTVTAIASPLAKGGGFSPVADNLSTTFQVSFTVK